MSVLHVAHRAGNDLARISPALALGADVVELDVKLRRGRLEVRHARSLGPLPVLWEPWHLEPDPGLLLRDLLASLPAGVTLMLDLKSWQPWLGRRVRDAMSAAGRSLALQPYLVCSRSWRLLEPFAGRPDVRVVHSARTSREVHRLLDHLQHTPTWGVSVHRDLLTAERVRRLRARAEVVMTWPVDTAEEYDRVTGLGVNGIITNDLAVLVER